MHTPFSTPSPPLSLPQHHWHPGGHQHLHRHPSHPDDGHHHRGHHHLLRASPCSCMLLQMCPTPSPDHAKCRCSFDRRVRLGEFRASLLLVCCPPPPQVRVAASGPRFGLAATPAPSRFPSPPPATWTPCNTLHRKLQPWILRGDFGTWSTLALRTFENQLSKFFALFCQLNSLQYITQLKQQISPQVEAPPSIF